ncbi:unnamed protein product [Caretta caretta]
MEWVGEQMGTGNCQAWGCIAGGNGSRTLVLSPAISLPPHKALQEVQIQLVGTAACNTLYNIDPDLNIGRDPVKPDMICAGYTKGQRDSCQGDSGGPLACYCNGTWFLMRIVSCGDGCGQPNRPSVYVQIVAYGEWIWGHMVSGGQATTMENSTSGINDARPSFSTYMLFFTTLLMSL